jgi:uncharacterized membrane protein YphA (DoxX/SURF4 family)
VATILRKLIGLYGLFITSTNSLVPYIQSSILLFLRIYIFSIFWASGLTKIADWTTTVILFQNEYKVPIIAPHIAAFISTFFELTMSVAVLIGLGARLAALPLIGMTLTIQYTYLNHHQHFEWVIVLLVILLCGAGKFSWDSFIRRKTLNDEDHSMNSLFISLMVVICLTILVLHEIIATLGDGESWLSEMLKWWNNIWAERIKT